MKSRNFILRNSFSLLFFLLVLTSFNKKIHPFYVSVTEIRVDTQKKAINVSCKMFTDDLQNALYKLYKAKANLTQRNPVNDSLITRYVKERMAVSLKNESVDLKFVGYEIEEEATWCYFECGLVSVDVDKVISVKTSILYDFLESQTNFLHCYYNDNRKSFKLNNPDQSAVFSF